jgi:predicted acetyltransferase
MDKIKLVKPCKSLEAEALVYRQEHFDCGEMIINGSSLFDKIETYDEWLLHVSKYSDKETVQPDWVTGSVFFGVRESDNKIVGVIDIRHYLNDFLSEYGGHIGFAVRPSERKKGYATEMLRLALNYCKGLGLDKVMMVCYKDNLPSIRTIEKCGGILEKEIVYLDGKPALIYWIKT